MLSNYPFESDTSCLSTGSHIQNLHVGETLAELGGRRSGGLQGSGGPSLPWGRVAPSLPLSAATGILLPCKAFETSLLAASAQQLHHIICNLPDFLNFQKFDNVLW